MRVRLKKQRKRFCFTLLELVIVCVIIGILAGLGVSSYRKVIVKAKAGKAKHAISLIVEAEKLFQIDSGVYINFDFDQANANVGSGVTGMDLLVVDNDSDFSYRVTGTNVIRARPRNPIGTCPAAAAGEITYTLSTGAFNPIPGCYQ